MKISKPAVLPAILLFVFAAFFSCNKTNPANPDPAATNTPSGPPTATLTATATPVYGTISGNVALPSGQAQLGVTYQVLVDTDMNFANGITAMAIGVCGSNENVPYSITVPAGTYYVYALVKTAGCLQCPPEQGDYLGWLGATYPANPASANTVVASNVTLSNRNITMVLAQNNVYGTITTAANCDGKNMILFADTDLDPSSGVFYMKVLPVSGSTGTGPYTFTYGLLAYFPGSFYFTAEIATNGHALPGAPETGDYVGYTGPQSINPAATAPGNGPYNFIANLF